MPPRLLLAFAALAAAGAAHAQLFKCVGSDGKTSYQSEPCPTAAKEEKLKLNTGPVSTGTPDAPGAVGTVGGMKPGWDQREIIFMADVCSKGILEPARKDFDEKSLPMPAPLAGDVDYYCGCLARRAAVSYTFIEYSKNPLGISMQLGNEAFAGGDCMPRGAHADLLRKAGKMK